MGSLVRGVDWLVDNVGNIYFGVLAVIAVAGLALGVAALVSLAF